MKKEKILCLTKGLSICKIIVRTSLMLLILFLATERAYSGWPTQIPVTTDSTQDQYPAVVASDSGHLWVTWYSYQSQYPDTPKVKASYFNGDSWQKPVGISPQFCEASHLPAITKSPDGIIWISWYNGYYLTKGESSWQWFDWGIYTRGLIGGQWYEPVMAESTIAREVSNGVDRLGRKYIAWSAQEFDPHSGCWVLWSIYLIVSDDGFFWYPPHPIAVGWSWEWGGNYEEYSFCDPRITNDDSAGVWLSYTQHHIDTSGVDRSVCIFHFKGERTDPKEVIKFDGLTNDYDSFILNDGFGKIWLVWVSNRDGNTNIYYSYRDENGWREPEAVTKDTNYDISPSLATDDSGGVWLCWASNRDGNFDIYVSCNRRGEWTSPEKVTDNPGSDGNPVIVVDDSNRVWVIWDYLENEDYNILSAYKRVEEGIRESQNSYHPRHFGLSQNYPNPFNSTTRIRYQVLGVRDQGLGVTLKIYNLLGEVVVALVDEFQRPGMYQVVWDGKDEEGRDVGSGVYFFQLKVGSFSQTRKMLLLR